MTADMRNMYTFSQKERLVKLEHQMGVVQDDLEDIKHDIKDLLVILNKAQGSYKTLLILLSISGFMGAISSKMVGVLEWLKMIKW